MPTADLEKLRYIVLQDHDLLAELKDISDRDEFIVRVIEIAKKKDLQITIEDVLEALQENRRSWVERWL